MAPIQNPNGSLRDLNVRDAEIVLDGLPGMAASQLGGDSPLRDDHVTSWVSGGLIIAKRL